MKIGIDARFFGSIGKGLGRYTQKLIENLEKIDQENQYIVFLRKENFDEYQPKNENFRKILADYQWYTFTEQIKMPLLLNKFNLDLVHFPHFNVPFLYRKKFVVTIHDLILLQFPTFRGTALNPIFYKIKFWCYKFVIWSAIKKAKKVITVSNFTKKELLKYYKKDLREEKIIVTYEAGNDLEKKDKNKQVSDVEILKKYGIIKPYMLYVGNAYPHKNLERMVLAFSSMNKAQKYQLALVGKMDYFYKRLKKLIEKKNIKNVLFLGQVSDEILDVIYKQSRAYVFPSLYEGFGIPPLEAMSWNIPVISSDHPCMKEILGDSAYFFNGQEKREIIQAMEKITTDEVLINSLIKKGLNQIGKYSWEKMATETLKIYNGEK
ncbi:MAG TPA: glycosyltransferase family 1 protein [Candidatus Moranbacteria bacterium]|nr:glycosyltransferase family 1 protein [Candidatus Moranbacteria bacterium]HRZ33801.1 glycosyltransferase family 1 protein [Candidatus Moranbacteria bacterium]